MSTGFLTQALPLIAAPMAGGATTVELVRAASGVGAFAFLAAGYKTPEVLAAEIAAARELSETAPAGFGVNLFVPSADKVDGAAFAAYARELAGEAALYDTELSDVPRDDTDFWDEKVSLLCADPVPVVSLTFGLPAPSDIVRIQRAGSAVLATVTSADEARAAAEHGVDGLIVQGPGAGGHSAVWDATQTVADAPTLEVLRAVRAITDLPLVAAGGVDGPESVREFIHGGAQSVAVGTLLLLTEEAGTSSTHRGALSSGAFTETVLTRVFTGRPARGLRNGFVERHAAHEITAYPAVHHLTRELRGKALAAGDTDRAHLWAGTGFRRARAEPAATTIERLTRKL
ncbi:NAD(P)H-dependent flavin oxidoreductase [Leucobacter aridicollis]|uniref:NAD(P)H-dependent flavin oxidoreductase n=1 Tax=Leucobacter aridicollis TaxID=283878 RepID=UPI000E651D6B|nr:nitronate monooxygenase [Leucobacter aridicollis]UTX53611.1 nitronate monooxygenase [Leucobacter aridicollis]